MLFNNNQFEDGFDHKLVWGEKRCYTPTLPYFPTLQDFLNESQNTVYGFLTYELKDQIEKLTSRNQDGIQIAPLHFFEPEHSIELHGHELFTCPIPASPQISQIKSRFTKEEYIHSIKTIQSHIEEGDIYELNFCMEFYCEAVTLDPIDLYIRLNRLSPTPFSCFVKHGDQYLISASPERYIKKTKNKITSQPIKGTIAIGDSPNESERNKKLLRDSIKDQAENLMIVDLVRNDLSKVSIPGSVEVKELFGIYPFKQVYQMISTITSNFDTSNQLVDIFQSTFPMGSMTGAPKIKAMELIEQYEKTKRGLFSGTVGYITPTGDFDFNVIIRSILYNQATGYLSFQVGSAITYDSDPEKEYEECQIKAKAIFECLK